MTNEPRAALPTAALPNPAAPPASVLNEAGASVFSRVTFSWAFPLLRLGARRPLESDDLGEIDSADCAANAAGRLASLMAPAGPASAPLRSRLLSAIVRLEAPLMAGAGAAMFVGALLGFVGPAALDGIVKFVQLKAKGLSDATFSLGGDPRASLEVGHWWVVALILASMLQNLLLHQHHMFSMRAALRVKAALAVSVYRKALRMSPRARLEFGVGKVNNLAQQDANSVSMVLWFIHYSWVSPIQLGICLWLLFRQLGPSAFVALAVLLAMLPLQARVMGMTQGFAKRTMAFSDARMKLVSEVFSGIRIVKLMQLESAFTENILQARASELAEKRKVAVLGALNTTLFSIAPLAVALLTFASAGLSSGSAGLSASEVFSSLALFNILRLPLMIIPMLVGSLGSASASLTRIADFLSAPDMVEQRFLLDDGASPVSFAGATLAWAVEDKKGDKTGGSKDNMKSNTMGAPKSDAKGDSKGDSNDSSVAAPALSEISVTFPTGKLSVVYGAVGSGKSSLLSSILGELELRAGKLSVPRVPIAFVQQTTFILNASVRDVS